MLGAVASAALICGASLLVGQAILTLVGSREWTLLSGPVGLALILSASAIVAGLGGRGTAIAVSLGVLTAAAAAVIALRRPPVTTPAAAILAAILAGLIAALPFIAAGKVGVLGVGLVNDDMAAHLLMADWIAERFNPEPELIGDGYPLGPHGLVAGLSTLLGARSIDVFAGLVVAIPALTALVAFAVLGALRPVARVAVSVLVALPYLIAAYLAQEAFKEPAMALLVLAFVVLLAERPAAGVVEDRYRWGRGLALGAIAAGVIYVYSFPGLAWLAATLGIWGLVELWRRRGDGAVAAARALAGAAAPAAVAGIATWALISLPDLGRLLDFTDFRALDPDRANEGGLGNLRGHLSPLEALGIWPTSEFRLPAGAGALPASAFYAGALVAAAGVALGLARWVRAGGTAIPVALLAAVVVYAGARGFGTVYTSAKALAIAAPLITLVGLGGLLADGGGRRLARIGLAAAIAVGMGASSLLVLRQAPVGPEDHLDELAEIRPLVAGEELLFLGRDNFVLYGLRGSRPYTHVRNFYNPYSVAPSRELEGVEGKFDLDAVDDATRERFRYVVTTRAAYASGPPPGYEPALETDSYVLWLRRGDARGREPAEDDGKPGATLDCEGSARGRGDAIAAWLPRPPVLAGDRDWRPTPTVEDGSPVAAELDLPAGDWDLSLQYDSTAPLTIAGPGLEVELPGNLDYRGAVPFWPAGRVEGHGGGALRLEVSIAPPPLAGRLLGAGTVAHLGTIAATPAGRGYGRARDLAEPPFPGSSARLSSARAACGRYADWTQPATPAAASE